MTEPNEQDQGRWTEEEVAAFRGALATCRDSLPPRQRDAFRAILATAAAQTDGDEVQGYVHPVLWGVAAGSIVKVLSDVGTFDAIDINKMRQQL